MNKRQSIICGAVLVIIVALMFLAVGGFMLAQMIQEDVSMVPDGYVLVEAEVKSIDTYQTEKTITSTRNRNRTEKVTATHYTADVTFEYNGQTLTGQVEGNPFVEPGDIVEIYYDPVNYVMKYDFTGVETFLAKLAYLPSIFILLVSGGIVIITLLVTKNKLVMYREENRISGTITDITEEINIQNRLMTKAYCTFTNPDTGMPVTIYHVSFQPLQLELGQSVPVWFNPKKPAASVMDLG